MQFHYIKTLRQTKTFRRAWAWPTCATLGLLLCLVSVNRAQTTAFTYQGKLTDAGNPANGNYDLQFKLFDTVTVGTGTQQGATLVRNPVVASVGVFTVTLDFGANVFGGADRYLEIGVRPAGNVGAYTTLAPRQPLTSTPYAIQTLNAQQLGGLPASGFVQNTAAPQAGANFNISGNGTANAFSLSGGAPPAVAPAGQGRLYFDTATSKVKVSENGGAFVNLVGASGVSGNGTVNTIPLWSAGTTLGNSVITQSANSNVGIGTASPNTRLTLNGGVPWTPDGWTASLNLQNIAALGWEANASGQRFGLGQSNGGLYFFRTNSAFGATGSPATYDLAIQDDGNLTQGRGKAGLVKAMIYVNANGSILRCYNGTTNASTGNCGFSISPPGFFAEYWINFGFQIDDRFVSVTPERSTKDSGAAFFFNGANIIIVNTFLTNGDFNNPGVPLPFMIIVY